MTSPSDPESTNGEVAEAAAEGAEHADPSRDPREGEQAVVDVVTPSRESLPAELRPGGLKRRGRTPRTEFPPPPAAEQPAAATPAGAPVLPEWAERAEPPDLRSPELYLNRELTWLQFNLRVLHEAQDPRTPLLERVKFLAIAANNIDEFFMKRIGGLKQQVGAGLQKLTVDGRTPSQQLQEIRIVVRDFMERQRQVYLELIEGLAQHDIEVVRFDTLSEADRAVVRQHFHDNVFPLLTPLAMDPAHPFPFISNLSLNLLVTLRFPEEAELTTARVKVPVGAGVNRFVRVGTGFRFVMLEDLIAHFLEDLFPGMRIETVEVFRVTRNANTERDVEQADDLLAMIEAELRERKFAPIVRLDAEVGIDATHRGMLAAELGLDEANDVYETDVMIGMRDLMELAQLDIPELHDPPHQAITNIKLQDRDNIFHILRENGPILLHHPYESFATSVTRFVREAATDPKVQAIKMTLYRTSADTNIIDHLIEAARNGKQVAVVVELKARFDEAANIRWAGRMEEAGIHVTYGVLGLKTHAKAILVVRRDYTGLRRYAHIGTGNYHAGTARLYCDVGMLTADPEVGKDLTELFNYLTTGCRPMRTYRKILAAPNMMKRALLAKIEREIALYTPEQPGLIRFKANALEDRDIVEALYRAAQAGVEVELIIRDTCRLRPRLPGLSETVTVLSIVGRFLEHARIYYFRNGGEEEYYIGSADLMTRNLETRVEILVPIEEPALRKELNAVLETQINDHRSAWEMQPDGTYIQHQPGPGRHSLSSQETLIAAAALRAERAKRLRKVKPRAFARRAPK
ncbi:MAG: polyphosphate kinase 1 [Rhodospirillales bacterium]|nr:MAG: polyphosphate kinase 1 [Rhodospirillales bacterium]